MANVEIINSPARTLVVDDYDPWRRHICVELKARPELQVVGKASDGLEAVLMCEELKPDLILLDIGLSNLNGIEVGKRICQLVPSAKVLFLSQNNDAEVVQAALGNGAMDMSSRPMPEVSFCLVSRPFLAVRGLSVAAPTQQQSQPFVVSPQMNKLLLLTFNIALCCQIAVAQRPSCSQDQEARAEQETDRLHTWDALYQSYRRYPHCDDGAVAEGYDEVVARLLLDHWDTLPQLAVLLKKNKRFQDFRVAPRQPHGTRHERPQESWNQGCAALSSWAGGPLRGFASQG